MYALIIAVVVASLLFSSLVVMSNLSVLAQEATPSLVNDVTMPANAATMGDKAYSPNPVEVKVGGGVTWADDDSQIHTATSGSAGSADSGSVFDSGILSPVQLSISSSTQLALMIITVQCIHRWSEPSLSPNNLLLKLNRV
jgi:plastocyanin